MLLEKIRAGDRDAYAELYERYRVHSTTLAHQIAPGEELDIVQEVWLRVWLRPPAIRTGFFAWLRVAITRSAGRRTRDRGRFEPIDDESIHSSMTSATREVARLEAVQLLDNAVREGRITSLQYDALVDDILDESSTTEMAAARGLSVSGFRDRVLRAYANIMARAN